MSIKLIKFQNKNMITELNIYVSLTLAALLLAFSVRLGVSLYQSK
jgi:hypothetical protein